MTTRNISPEQRQWSETWIAGLRDGTHSSLGGFPRKLLDSGIISSEEATALAGLGTAPGVSASTIADVIDDALFNGMTVMEARASHGLEDLP